jgi:hypothetical protein
MMDNPAMLVLEASIKSVGVGIRIQCDMEEGG